MFDALCIIIGITSKHHIDMTRSRMLLIELQQSHLTSRGKSRDDPVRGSLEGETSRTRGLHHAPRPERQRTY